MPQIRKFFVFGTLLVVYSTFQTVKQVYMMAAAWAVVASLSATVGISQFLRRLAEANRDHADRYIYLVDNRLTGFASHWMTFGGEAMVVLLMWTSLLFFAPPTRWKKLPAVLVAVLLLGSIALNMTRCVFLLGLPAGLAYLLWQRSRALLLTGALLAAAGFFLAPGLLHKRISSVATPTGPIDSNLHRKVCRLTGYEMIKAHPWLGLGPEQVGKQFQNYVPASVARPLPTGWYGHLHNVYLQYAAERGIPASLCMMWLIGKFLFDAARHVRRSGLDPHSKAVLHGAIAVTLGILAEGLFEHNLGDSEVLTLFLTVVACSYSVMQERLVIYVDHLPRIQGRHRMTESPTYVRQRP